MKRLERMVQPLKNAILPRNTKTVAPTPPRATKVAMRQRRSAFTSLKPSLISLRMSSFVLFMSSPSDDELQACPYGDDILFNMLKSLIHAVETILNPGQAPFKGACAVTAVGRHRVRLAHVS